MLTPSNCQTPGERTARRCSPAALTVIFRAAGLNCSDPAAAADGPATGWDGRVQVTWIGDRRRPGRAERLRPRTASCLSLTPKPDSISSQACGPKSSRPPDRSPNLLDAASGARSAPAGHFANPAGSRARQFQRPGPQGSPAVERSAMPAKDCSGFLTNKVRAMDL
jgi:hypothetical protein